MIYRRRICISALPAHWIITLTCLLLKKNAQIPRKSIIREPWMTAGLLKSAKTRDKLFKKQLGKEISHPARQKFLDYRNLLNKVKKYSKETHYRELLSQYKNDVRKTWGVINSIIGRQKNKPGDLSFLKLEDRTITSPLQIADKFSEFFANVGPKYAQAIKTKNL